MGTIERYRDKRKKGICAYGGCKVKSKPYLCSRHKLVAKKSRTKNRKLKRNIYKYVKL